MFNKIILRHIDSLETYIAFLVLFSRLFLKYIFPPLLEIEGILQNFQNFFKQTLLVLDDILNHLYGLETAVLGAIGTLTSCFFDGVI